MEEAQLQRRLLELAQRAYDRAQYTYTGFLNLAQLQTFAQLQGSVLHVPHALWGGAEGCERKLLRFGSVALCGYEESWPINCVRMQPAGAKFADELSHRDFLGALMNLGVERSTMGDIRVAENCGYVFVLERVAPFIMEQLRQVRHTAVVCEVMEGLPAQAALLTQSVRVQVSSERLDAIIAHLHKLSRADAQALFAGGRVFVNDKLQENSSYTPRAGEAISVRGYGKFRYCGVVGETRKGKLVVEVEQYV